jgi:hypothetical protein
MTSEEVLPIYKPTCQHLGICKQGGSSETYQEDDRDVQEEGAETVQEEGAETDGVDLRHAHARNLPDESDKAVHGSADGGKVVERDQRVHLVLGRAEQSLDQVEADGLEHDTTKLVEETNPDKLDLAKGGNDDTDDNGRDVQQNLHVGGSNAHDPTREEHGDGGGCLEHLDKGNAEVQVGQVTADQTQAEEDTNGHNGTQVDTARHLHGLATIEQRGVAGHELGSDGGKGQVVGGQDDGVACIRRVSQHSLRTRWLCGGGGRLTEAQRVQNPLVEQDDGGRKTNPCSAAFLQSARRLSLVVWRCIWGRTQRKRPGGWRPWEARASGRQG